jgi:hypothetical protein
MANIELTPGLNGEVVSKLHLLVAGDLARLKALSDPRSGIVGIDYLLLVDNVGAKETYITNFATRDFGATEYEDVLKKNMPAILEMNHLAEVKDEVE